MPITFEQPGAYDRNISSAYGAAQALKDFAPYLSRAYPGGHGGGGGNISAGPGGFQGLGGGGGGDGGVAPPPVDPLALYAGKQEIDRYYEEQDRRKAIDAIRANTAPDPTAGDAQIAALQQRMSGGQGDTSEASGGDTTAAAASRASQGDTSEAGEVDEEGNQLMPQVTRQASPDEQRGPPPAPQPEEFTQADALQLQRLTASRAAVQAQMRNGMVDPGTANRMIQQLQMPMSVLRQQQAAAQVAAQQQQQQQRMHAQAEQTQVENMNDEQRSQWIARRTVRLPNGGMGYVDRNGDIKPLPQEHLDRRAQAEQARQTREDKADTDERKRFDDVLKDVEKTVLGTTERDKDPTPAQQRRIDAMMRARGFHASTASEHMEAFHDQPMTNRPESQWTDRQRREVAGLNQTRAEINQMAPGTVWAGRMNRRLQQAEEIYKRWGNERRMPEEDRDRFTELRRSVLAQMNQPWGETPPQGMAGASNQALQQMGIGGGLGG